MNTPNEGKVKGTECAAVSTIADVDDELAVALRLTVSTCGQVTSERTFVITVNNYSAVILLSEIFKVRRLIFF